MQNKGRGLVDRKLVKPTPSLSNCPKAALLFCSLVDFYVVYGYLLFFLIEIK